MINDNGKIQCKRYPHGKVIISSKGSPDYAAAAEMAFTQSVKLVPQFDQGLFTKLLKEQSVPEEVINEFVENASLENSLRAMDHPDLEMMQGVSSSIVVSKG